MKNILILANSDIGLYKFRKELIESLMNVEYKIYISLPDGEFVQPLINLGCTFINTDIDRRGVNLTKDSFLLFKYFKIIKKVKPHYVITYTIKPNIYGSMVCRVFKIPYYVNITGLGFSFQKNALKNIVIFLYKVSLKNAKKVFFENEENLKVFLNNKIITGNKVCLLNGAGVNLDEFKFCDYPNESKKIHFLFIGRIMKEKGINELFDCAKTIKHEFNNIDFDIVGPLEGDYAQLIDQLQKSDVINYYGFQSDVKPFIKNAHCLILPSYHEGMANTLLESGAMGRPLITSNIHGCKEAVIDGETGYLVEAKNSNDLYDKIKKFISLPYKNKVEMGLKSNKYIANKFNRKEIVSQTLEVLN